MNLSIGSILLFYILYIYRHNVDREILKINTQILTIRVSIFNFTITTKMADK